MATTDNTQIIENKSDSSEKKKKRVPDGSIVNKNRQKKVIVI